MVIPTGQRPRKADQQLHPGTDAERRPASGDDRLAEPVELDGSRVDHGSVDPLRTMLLALVNRSGTTSS